MTISMYGIPLLFPEDRRGKMYVRSSDCLESRVMRRKQNAALNPPRQLLLPGGRCPWRISQIVCMAGSCGLNGCQRYNDDVDQGWRRRRLHSTGRTIITIKAAGNAIHVMRKTEAALRGRTHDNTNATITARASILPTMLTMVSLPSFICFPFGVWLVLE